MGEWEVLFSIPILPDPIPAASLSSLLLPQGCNESEASEVSRINAGSDPVFISNFDILFIMNVFALILIF